MQWLTDLAELCEIEDLKVTPDRRFLKGNDYIAVVVKVDADARYEQLVRFLYLFNRTDLLHRITAIRVSTKESEGDPFLKVQFEAEGMRWSMPPPDRNCFLKQRSWKTCRTTEPRCVLPGGRFSQAAWFPYPDQERVSRCHGD